MTAHHRGTHISRSLPHQSGGLVDNHGRRITYLRLAITDRCNLRCRYCMPEEGVSFVPHADILSFEELERLVRLLAGLGIDKVRLTGGEPFVRHNCLPFMERLRSINGIRSLNVTTNGVETARYLDGLAGLGINGINLSLDTLDRERFRQITRRDALPQVLATLDGALKRRLPLKINAVVQEDTEDAEILALAALARRHTLSLRFIEKMPFSGSHGAHPSPVLPLRDRLHILFPSLVPMLCATPTTARQYTVPNFVGTIGLIEGNSRRFCASCNKIRITPLGMLKTCLYDHGVLDLRAMLRGGADDPEIAQAVTACVHHRFANGHETQQACQVGRQQSMATIGG